MSEQVQKQLSQLVKTQLEKKSSKNSDEVPCEEKKPEVKKFDKNKEEHEAQKQKMQRSHEAIGAHVSEEETWAMYRRLIVDNAVRFFMILLYCGVAFIAVAKAGIIILTAFQQFLHGILATGVPPIMPKS